MRLKPWSWPAGALIVAVAALASGLIITDRSGEAAIARQQAANAAAARDYFVAFAREEGVGALAKALNRKERLGSPDGFRYALIGANGETEAGADIISSLDNPDQGWRTVVDPEKAKKRWRVLAQPLDGRRTLIVGEDLSARDAFRAAVLRGSVADLLLTIVAVAAFGVMMNALLLRRTRHIAETAERIAGGDLSARAEAHPRGDVFDDLGASLNAMLARIEELMTGMRTVTDSLAHDLRSPLTRVHAALARAADPALPEPQRLAAIEHAQDEAERMLATLSALLDIARAEAGLSRELMRHLDVGALAGEMGDLFGPVLEDAGQELACETAASPLILQGHELLLRQAIGNLLHNAATHAGPGARVELFAREEVGDRLVIGVADSGPGVPADQLGRVSERFVRLAAARTTPGSGLGLAMVAACAKLHGGRLLLSDNRPGLRAELELPKRGWSDAAMQRY